MKLKFFLTFLITSNHLVASDFTLLTETKHSVDGSAWAEETPVNMAPPLKEFF